MNDHYDCIMRDGNWVVKENWDEGKHGPFKHKKNAELLCKLLNEFWAAPAGFDEVEDERQFMFKMFLEIKRERGIEV